MVIGENADFMEAELLQGKTYYAAVTVRMGVWKARFSLRAMHRDELLSDPFPKWFNACKWVENTDMSHKWAQDNRSSIVQKREKYLVKWNQREPEAHKVLLPEDGR